MNTELTLTNNDQRHGLNKFTPTVSNKLMSLRNFPLPIFLLKRDMTLVETNSQGELAITKHWVGVNHGKMHFNNRQHDKQIAAMVENLFLARDPKNIADTPSKRFILRNIDTEFRAYTMSIESPESDDILLFIQSDLSCSDSKLQSITNVFSLSLSEAKIVKLMVDGLKPKEIAYEAGISLNTVRSHLRTLYAKMQVNGYNEALTAIIKLLV